MKFQSYEIGFVGRFHLDGQDEACIEGKNWLDQDIRKTRIERLIEGEPEEDDSFIESFWTLYGRLPNGQAVAIFDSSCFQGCLDIYEHITGHEPDPNLPTPGWEGSYKVTDLPV